MGGSRRPETESPEEQKISGTQPGRDAVQQCGQRQEPDFFCRLLLQHQVGTVQELCENTRYQVLRVVDLKRVG